MEPLRGGRRRLGRNGRVSRAPRRAGGDRRRARRSRDAGRMGAASRCDTSRGRDSRGSHGVSERLRTRSGRLLPHQRGGDGTVGAALRRGFRPVCFHLDRPGVRRNPRALCRGGAAGAGERIRAAEGGGRAQGGRGSSRGADLPHAADVWRSRAVFADVHPAKPAGI